MTVYKINYFQMKKIASNQLILFKNKVSGLLQKKHNCYMQIKANGRANPFILDNLVN